jgi:hypothetical protein
MVTLVNRAKVSTATTGTGTITLGAAESGYQTFADAGVVDADVVRYVIEDGTDWEIGTGTYTATGTTLSRTVLESSNADAAINLSGSAVVFVGAAAEDLAPVLELYAENPSSPTAPSATGANAVAIGSEAVASTIGSLAAGFRANASGSYGLALGRQTTASGSTSVAIGYNSIASGTLSVAIGGFRVSAFSSSSTAIGNNSGSSGAQAVTGSGAMALGGSYASGTDSFAAAIANNTATYGATGANSIAIGKTNKAQSTWSSAVGGSLNIASDTGATVTGGYINTASGLYSRAGGRQSKSDKYGKDVWASGQFSAQGDAQSGTFVLRSDTTSATPKALTADNGTAGNSNQIILPNNSAYAFHGTIVARQQASGGTACAAWKVEGLIRREGSAGTTVLVNSATTILDNTPDWGMALSADTTNGGLKIEVTGAAATNIRWVATLNTSEVTY